MDQGAALVVGAGDALGGAIARRFLRSGLATVVSRRKAGPMNQLLRSFEEEGLPARGIACDARDEERVAELFDRVEQEVGPLQVCVFNIGAQHSASILDMTSRIYRQVWESAAFSGFLVGREAARRMVPRGEGTIIFTGATASIRGGAGFASFAGAKHALRALAQSMARELGPRGIHVGHVIVDGMIESEAVRQRFPDRVAALPDSAMLDPDHIAEAYWSLHVQPPDAWTFELDLRPALEKW